MMRRFRPLMIVLGGLLLVGSLLGAKLLATGTDQTPKTAAPPTNGKNGTGPIVFGYADSDPRPILLGLPPVMQSGQVAQVFVKEGDEVKKDQELFAFNSSVQEADLKIAEQAILLANAKLNEAKAALNLHAEDVKVQKLKLDAAQTKVKFRESEYNLAEINFREGLKTQNIEPAKIDDRVKNDPDLYRRRADYQLALLERDSEKAKLEVLESVEVNKYTLLIKEAEASVKQAEAMRDKAKAVVDQCTVRSKEAGTIEQINVGPGDTLGIGTQTPAMILVPAGPRVVRAEIEAEFAHKIGTDKIGKVVTIYDNSDSKITYKGTVKRVSGSFLAKRGAGPAASGLLAANETRVLEAVIEVTDPAPAGQPPLRVGQKVRVNFGQ